MAIQCTITFVASGGLEEVYKELGGGGGGGGKQNPPPPPPPPNSTLTDIRHTILYRRSLATLELYTHDTNYAYLWNAAET